MPFVQHLGGNLNGFGLERRIATGIVKQVDQNPSKVLHFKLNEQCRSGQQRHQSGSLPILLSPFVADAVGVFVQSQR